MQLAAILRGLADQERNHDPVLQAEADALLAQISETMSEAPLRVALHRLYRPIRGNAVMRPPNEVDLAALHRACHAVRPVSFAYADGMGNRSRRQVLPLELVHAQSGILLLAFCQMRDAHRKFYVHGMSELKVLPGDFAGQRLALLAAALDQEESRRYSS